VNIHLTEEVLQADISASFKLVIGAVRAHPGLSRKQVAKALGVARNTVFAAMREAKKRGICVGAGGTEIGTVGGTEIGTGGTEIGTHSTKTVTPHPIDICKKKEGAAPSRRKPGYSGIDSLQDSPPTKEEVVAYAEGLGRLDLAENFYVYYTGTNWCTAKGDPISSWRRAFSGWARRSPKPAPRKVSLEEALYDVDNSY
tara:strand:- start:598 stop:1194 length:597 start_codon:yes stop_codon:yes gene_type:complete